MSCVSCEKFWNISPAMLLSERSIPTTLVAAVVVVFVWLHEIPGHSQWLELFVFQSLYLPRSVRV